MATQVQSLFGLTPDAIRAQQQADLDAQALQFSKLSPTQQAQMSLFRGASQLGSGIAGALGYQDPEIIRAQQRQRMLTELDTSTPESLLQAAQTAQRSGEFALAQGLQSQAMEMAKRGAEIGKLAAETQKAQRETDPIQELAKTGKYSTASLAKYAKTRDVADLELTSPMTPTEIERLQAYRDTLTDPKKIAEVNAAITGATEGRGTKISVGGPQVVMPDTRGKSFEEADKETLKEFRAQARASQGALSFIGQALSAIDSGAVVGQGFPSVVRGINSFLAPLGINAETVASTRNLEQALNSVIAQGIKQYGSNPSTVDLEFAKRTAANIQDPKEAIKATLQYLQKRTTNTVERLDAAEQWLLNRGNLGGFEREWAKREQESLKTPARGGQTQRGTKYQIVEE